MRFKSKEDEQKFTLKEQRRLGCKPREVDDRMTVKAEMPYKTLRGQGGKFWTCPQKIKKQMNFGDYLQAFWWLENHGMLPYGDLSTVSERFVQIIDEIRMAYKSCEKEERESGK